MVYYLQLDAKRPSLFKTHARSITDSHSIPVPVGHPSLSRVSN